MQQDLLAIRSQLTAAIARVDQILANTAPTTDDPLRWRLTPGGPLSEEGITEIRRRFALGETDAVIARDMGISVQGVQKRRTDFNAVSRVAD
jgi:DNA-binding transcriptional regulator YiaG